jgi:hypothetical protein
MATAINKKYVPLSVLGLDLNTQMYTYNPIKEEHHTDIGGYFQILIGGLMATSFVVLALIVLNAYYGKDDQEDEE